MCDLRWGGRGPCLAFHATGRSTPDAGRYEKDGQPERCRWQGGLWVGPRGGVFARGEGARRDPRVLRLEQEGGAPALANRVLARPHSRSRPLFPAVVVGEGVGQADSSRQTESRSECNEPPSHKQRKAVETGSSGAAEQREGGTRPIKSERPSCDRGSRDDAARNGSTCPHRRPPAASALCFPALDGACRAFRVNADHSGSHASTARFPALRDPRNTSASSAGSG